MLVLSRFENERIQIGTDIWITVVEIRPDGGVRIGIEAPPEVEILRENAKCRVAKKERGAKRTPGA